ncbi:N-hydroxyarylamine O-acetyltransferase [Pedococcus dokdonensis]|uniref:N-hydroxyarylamine O-acetyltransferase n=1 Tax=Pedococcus dokdonensis TaxID=443156 RepID=A0A1H0M906_9MICO|nr:arylamine N-acetyltransferase [Pedococcus dokdonensis]SDO76893.1 N-hydroxyarylamine O-acetyltransferase [Pedococcus dokdonensis]
MTEGLDLAAYLDRVGIGGAPAPDLAALQRLHEAHVRTFTFDNIDVLLEQHPGVELADVQAKFVGRGRGGYCFEHATLFAAVLDSLGFDVERRLARVGDVTAAARTHCVVTARIDGTRWLCDPGFGHSLLHPIRLEDGAEEDFGGWSFRVCRLDRGASGATWELQRHRDGAWELMHTTDELPVQQVDLRAGHHFTSTYPTSHFRHGLMFTRHLPGRHVAVTHEGVTVRRPGEPTEHHDLSEGELEALLTELRVGLTDDETERLLAVVGQLRTQSP